MTYAADLPDFTASQLDEARCRDFIRMVSCLADLAKDSDGFGPRRLSDDTDRMKAAELHAQRWPRSINRDIITKSMQYRIKTAVNPGVTTEPSWAAPLATVRPLIDGFVARLRTRTLVDQLLALPNGARRVPFNMSMSAVTGSGTFRFVGQGAPKPTGNLQLASAILRYAKASGIIVITEELAKVSTPSAETVVRDDMTRGMALYLDTQLTDPTVAAVADVSPASITNGALSIASAGASAANAATDVKKLIETFAAANPNAENIVMLMSPSVATAMAIATASTTLGPNGGALFGVTVLTGAIGGRIVVLDPSALLVADDGDMDATVSRHATVEFDTAPTSPITAGSVYINLWQAGLVGVKLDRFMSWRMARANAVTFTNVSYT
jgi:hypothetical protein